MPEVVVEDLDAVAVIADAHVAEETVCKVRVYIIKIEACTKCVRTICEELKDTHIREKEINITKTLTF